MSQHRQLLMHDQPSGKCAKDNCLLQEASHGIPLLVFEVMTHSHRVYTVLPLCSVHQGKGEEYIILLFDPVRAAGLSLPLLLRCVHVVSVWHVGQAASLSLFLSGSLD